MRTFVLRDKAVLERCIAFLRTLVGGEQLFAVTVTFADRKRTLEQNDRLHALIRRIAEEAWAGGKQWSADDWKPALLRQLGFADSHVDPITGETVSIPQQTSQMSVKRLSELMLAIERYAADHLGLEV